MPEESRPEPDSPVLSMNIEYALEEGERKIWGRASLPKVDQENELVTREALENALENYMYLPAISYNHTERVVGFCKRAYFGDDDGLYIEGVIKPTSDCDDVWERIQAGTLNQFSIFGHRTEGNEYCRLSPEHRMKPCVTSAMNLYAISVCPVGNAINEETFVKIAKGIEEEISSDVIQKSDGEELPTMTDQEGAPASSGEDVLQKILQTLEDLNGQVGSMNDRITSLEGSVGGAEEPDEDEGMPDDVEKGDEGYEDEPDGGDSDDSYEEDAGSEDEGDEDYPDDGYEDDSEEGNYDEHFSLLASALKQILINQQRLEEKIGGGSTPGSEVSKCGIKKAVPDRITEIENQITEIRDMIKKSQKPGLPPVIVPDLMKKAKDENSVDTENIAALNYESFGGL